MKKILLTFMAAIGLAASANAQLALETFDAAGATGTIPAGWAMQSDGHTVSTSFVSGLPWVRDSLNLHAWMPISGTYTGFGAASDYQMLTTSYFTPANTADRWLMTPAFTVTSPYMVIQWQDNDLGSGESINVLASATASTVTGTYTSIYSAAAGSGALVTHQAAIGTYNGTSIRVAFRDHTANNWGLVIDNVQTAIIDSIDLAVKSLNIPAYIQTGSSNPVTGTLQNNGALNVTSTNLNYSINGGAPVVTTIPGLSIALGSTYTYTSGTPWVPATAGTYTVKVWVDNINGSYADQIPADDTLTTTINVLDSLQPKRVMIEEFTQASCDPCANAHVNVDTVYANNLADAVLLRYHVNFPGRDCMDSVTLSPFVSARLSYYSVSGVPDAQVDGQYVYPGAGYLTSAVIHSEVIQGSPFKISITPSYDGATETYSFTATITAYSNIASGLTAYAALVVDTLTYAANQSTETIPQTIFPQVAEAMFPNSGGTALTSFTTGSTQTVNSTWVKSHRWGSDYSVWHYDSTLTGKIIVWIENNTTKYVYQSAYADVATGVLGVNAVTNDNGSLNIYPNPAANSATIALNLKTAADVKMEVYNIAGQVVYSTPVENRNAGNSISRINLSNFANGDYIVRVSIGNEVLNQKLSVTK